MSVRISQIHDPVRDCVLVRVEGSLNYRNSLLLEQVCQGIQAHSGQPVVINLEDLPEKMRESSDLSREAVGRG